MSKKIESNGFIANWSKIINSQCREDAEKDNKAKHKIVVEDHKNYGVVYTIPVDEKPKSKKAKVIDPAVKEGFAKDMDELLNW
jgi:hypothetical protein